jgi:hypothetical protein
MWEATRAIGEAEKRKAIKLNSRENDWIVASISMDRPNPARIYDYLLGGHHNFAADRAAAEKLIESVPDTREGAVVHRAFVRRAIGLFVADGIDQFLDIGSGLPTVGNVHDVARATIPEARVVYVDIDPVVIAHSSQMLRDVPGATIIQGDIRYPSSILEHQEVVDLLDFGRPLGLTMTAVLHYLTDDELAYGAAATLIGALSPGSYVAISHGLVEERRRDLLDKAVDVYKSASNLKLRTRDGIARFFDGLEFVEPGLVRAPLWRPEGPDDPMLNIPEVYTGLVGVGRKP